MAIVLSDIGALLSNSAPEVLRNMYRWSDDSCQLQLTSIDNTVCLYKYQTGCHFLALLHCRCLDAWRQQLSSVLRSMGGEHPLHTA